MSQAEALKLLGFPVGASQEQIRIAHRRLMIRYHPDHGGDAQLAARINQAKDVLLGR
jgi:curved DNA-binding protein CbpA